MSVSIRAGLIFLIAAFAIFADRPSALADKKNESNSSSDDNGKKEKKEKDDNGQQTNQGRNREGQRDENQNSRSRQFQNVFQGGSRQSNSNNSQQSQNIQQSNPFQKSLQRQQQLQKLQKQNGQQLNLQKQNVQQQDNKDKEKWQKKSQRDHKELRNWVIQFGGPEPFSARWYQEHPKAWHHRRHHDHDDDWKAITAVGVLGFLGWQAYQQRGPVVIYEPVPYDTLFVAQPGVVIDPAHGEWMPLGVYSLMVGPGDVSTRLLDLAVDRRGHIRGSYYDMISSATYNVAGIIDQRTQYAQWSLESNRQLTFYTPLSELTRPQGIVTVRLPSGQRQEWQLVRMESEY
jgi:hypothetical protein